MKFIRMIAALSNLLTLGSLAFEIYQRGMPQADGIIIVLAVLVACVTSLIWIFNSNPMVSNDETWLGLELRLRKAKLRKEITKLEKGDQP